MTTLRRVPLTQFVLINQIYAQARVWAYSVDEDGVITDEKVTLYDGPTGTGTLANPLDLDSDGRWPTVPYVEERCQLSINTRRIGNHLSAIVLIPGTDRGLWSPGVIYQRGDTVKDGPAGNDTGSIYIIMEDHTSGSSFSTDLGANLLQLYIDVGAVNAAVDLAEEWATKLAAPVEGTLYSSKEHAIGSASGAGGSSKAWAITAEDSTVPGGAGAFSSLHHAAKAADAETAAELAETNAEAAAVTAGLAAVAAQTAETNAETAETNAEAAAAAAAVAQAAAEAAQAAAEAIVDDFDPPLPLAIGNGGTAATDAATARDNLGLEIGVDIQGYSTILGGMAAATPPIANQGLYFTAPGVAAPYFVTSTGRTIVAASSMTNARDLLGVEIGADVQAWDADIDAIAALGSTGFAVRTGAGAWAQRTITAGANVTISGGDGVSGDVTIDGAGGGATAEVISANDTLVGADSGKSFVVTATCTVSLTAAATLGSGWYCRLAVEDAPASQRRVTVSAAANINGSGNDPVLYSGEDAIIYCTGSEFHLLGVGGMVLIDDQDAPSASTWDFYVDGLFLDDNAFSGFIVHADELTHDNGSSRTPQLQVINTTGTVMSSSGDYNIAYLTAFGTPAGTENSTATALDLTPSTIAASVTVGAWIEIMKHASGIGSTIRIVRAQNGVSPDIMFIHSDTPIGGLRFLWNGAGNFDNGTIKVWGIRK